MNLLKKTISFILTFIISINLFAQGSWKLEKDKEGVKVYLREYKNDKQAKAEMIVNSSLAAIVALLKDESVGTDWIDRANEFKVVKTNGDKEWYTYTEISLPFPYSNRDMIIKNILSQNSSKVVKITTDSEHTLLPVDDDLERVEVADGYWELTPIGKGQVKVFYQVYVEMGVKAPIPNWVKDPMMADGILDTMVGMKEMLPNYQSKKLSYITE